MMKRSVQKMMSVLTALCLMLGLCAGATAQTAADFEALAPLMDLVAAASWYSPDMPESVYGADTSLSATFVNAFFGVLFFFNENFNAIHFFHLYISLIITIRCYQSNMPFRINHPACNE